MSADTKTKPSTDLVGRVFMRPPEFKDPEVYMVVERYKWCENHAECYCVKCTDGQSYHIVAEDIF